MADIERKLASVRRIAAIDPIEGADQIVCVTVDGWKLVSNKENGFKVGDLVIYFEIDSFLPIRPEFEWMRERCYKNVPGLGEGFRVKTIKLRGQVSQGLIIPLSDFLYYIEGEGNWYMSGSLDPIQEGDDLTEYLGVRKYEKPLPAALAGTARGNFPSFLRKTDQERIQNCWGGVKKWIFFDQDLIEQETDLLTIDNFEAGIPAVDKDGNDIVCFKSGDMWFRKTPVRRTSEEVAKRSMFEATLKLDGSSITIYHNEGQIGVCSRNLDLKRDPNNTFWKTVLQSGILMFLVQHGGNIAIQGELMGPGIQDNREKLEHHKIFVFDIFDIDNQRYLTPDERFEYWNMIYGSFIDISIIDKVPSIGPLNITEEFSVQEFLDLADKVKSINHDIAEGIVFKSMVENGPTFKVISNKYLLKEKD